MRLGIVLVSFALLAAPCVVVASPPEMPKPNGDIERITDGFPDRNGPFSAMVSVIPGGQVAEFDKPQDQAPHITPVHTARVGDEVAIKFVFTGPQANADGMIDVTYDVKILQPDGALYDNLDEHDLPALQVKVEATNWVFDNRMAVVGLRLEAKDQAGVYQVIAVLHDNVAKRDIPLKTQFELIK